MFRLVRNRVEAIEAVDEGFSRLTSESVCVKCGCDSPHYVLCANCRMEVWAVERNREDREEDNPPLFI